MRRHRLRQIALGGLAAAGVSAVLAGCGSGAPVDPAPRTAAEAGRGVFRSDTGGSPAGPTVPEPVEIAERTLPAEPVAAPKPETKAEPAGVALASAEIPSVSAAEIPAVIDPAADPSRYPGGIVPASPNAQPLPGGPRLLVPERTFRLEGRPRALRVTYDDLDLLRVLNMGDPLPPDVVDHFPDWLKDLDGKTIRIRGFMYPSYEQELSRFILTRDTGVCCFGPNPKVYYLVGVKLKEGTTVRYIGDRPFDVVGTFHIDPVYSDGQWYQLYKITDATVVE